MLTQRPDAEHGIVCRLPNERFGYFGWPTLARMEDGTLLVASSGLRSQHVCPYGKTVLNVSRDEGRSWSAPRVIQDSAIDDRDAGIVNLGGGRLLVSWFRSDTRKYIHEQWLPETERRSWAERLSAWTDQSVSPLLGSWVMRSEDGGKSWGEPLRAPVTAPHGPIRLQDGGLFYLGKRFSTWEELRAGSVCAARSADGGRTWETLGAVPAHPGVDSENFHEPHVVELPSGRLLGMIRVDHQKKDAEIPSFTMLQTASDDGGSTWSPPQSLGFHGSPPHLLRHSSGTLVLSYSFRQAPFGQRVALSHDDGASWKAHLIIRDDGHDFDLGYPSTVELADKSLLTVYYQKAARGEKCSLLWSRWRLPNSLL